MFLGGLQWWCCFVSDPRNFSTPERGEYLSSNLVGEQGSRTKDDPGVLRCGVRNMLRCGWKSYAITSVIVWAIYFVRWWYAIAHAIHRSWRKVLYARRNRKDHQNRQANAAEALSAINAQWWPHECDSIAKLRVRNPHMSHKDKRQYHNATNIRIFENRFLKKEIYN